MLFSLEPLCTKKRYVHGKYVSSRHGPVAVASMYFVLPTIRNALLPLVQHYLRLQYFILKHPCCYQGREWYDSYQILTKDRVLDRQYPISELNPLPEHIEVGIPDRPPTHVETLQHGAVHQSTTEKVSIIATVDMVFDQFGVIVQRTSGARTTFQDVQMSHP